MPRTWIWWARPACGANSVIYAGNYLVSHSRMGPTLLSAAFDIEVLRPDFVPHLGAVGRQNQKQNQDQIQRQRTGVSTPHEQKPNLFDVLTSLTTFLWELSNEFMSETSALAHKYEYRRRLPHYQKADRALFVTFRKLIHEPFAEGARDLVLQHFRHDDGKRYLSSRSGCDARSRAHVANSSASEPEGWPCSLPIILKLIEGVSARSVMGLLGSCRPIARRISSIMCCGRMKVSRRSLGVSGRIRCRRAW